MLAMMTDLASFGAAGLMGAMWLWERRINRQREEQLQQAHERIRRDEQRLAHFAEIVQQNSAMLARFTETQRELTDTLKRFIEEIRHARSKP